MTDIVERLRQKARGSDARGEGMSSQQIEWIAADEIERLRGELAEQTIRAAAIAVDNGRLRYELAQLKLAPAAVTHSKGKS